MLSSIMWLLLLLVGVQSAPGDWEISDQASISTQSFTLNPALAHSKGQLRYKLQQQTTTLDVTFAFQSSCPRTRDEQGISVLLSAEPAKPGKLFGAQDVYEGAMIMVNHRTQEVSVVLGDGKRQVRERDRGLKCTYLDPKANTTLKISLSQRKLSLYIGPDSNLCGAVDFPMNRFYIGLSGIAASEPCSNIIYDFTLETCESESSLEAIGTKIGEMDEEIADVIGEIGEMVDEFS